MEALTGKYDMSLPLHDVTKYCGGDEPAKWLIVQGRPTLLRPGGWVYIRTEAELVARVKAVGSGTLSQRRERTGSPPGVRGPGPVVFIDPGTWDDTLWCDLSVDRSFYGQGIRYLRTFEDGSLQHWKAQTRKDYGPRLHPGKPPPRRRTEPTDNPHLTTGDEAGADGWMIEGAATITQVVRYERDPKAREACLKRHGHDCAACGVNFGDVYGHLGEGFIHVHHLREISSIGREYVINPTEDLRPLCPNCHAMVHRRKPALSIEELKRVLLDARGD